jgi:hypothetical protein
MRRATPRVPEVSLRGWSTMVDGERALRRQIVRGQGRTVVEFLKRYNPVGSGYPEKVAAFGRLIMFDNQIDLFQTIGVNCAVLNCDLKI